MSLLVLGISYVPNGWTWTGAVLAASFIAGAWFFVQWYRRVEFYANRKESPEITNEIGRAEEVWISWHVGTIISAGDALKGCIDGVQVGKKITKALLLQPATDQPATDQPQYLPIHVLSFSPLPLKKLTTDINVTIRNLKDSGAKEVKTYNGPLGHFTIFNPGDPKKTRVRVETWAPNLAENNRPIYYVSATRHPEVTRSIVAAFSATWKDAHASE